LAAPAQVCSLIVSDVPGDAPGEVASGPTVPGRPAPAEVLDMVQARGIALPERLLAHLSAQPGSAIAAQAAHVTTHIIASAAISLDAAAAAARAQGVNAWVLSDAIEGEARDVASVHAALTTQALKSGFPHPAPLVLLSGGETTVTLRHKGRGGRNSEFALALALALEGVAGVTALAADTDGIDGSEDNAGAFVDASTAARMRAAGINPQVYLGKNDAYAAFEAVGDLFVTGPTGTNVNDFRAILLGHLP
jgi:hydroxypyruvate reductase